MSALLSFVESDAQRIAATAQAALEKELGALQALDVNIFPEGARLLHIVVYRQHRCRVKRF